MPRPAASEPTRETVDPCGLKHRRTRMLAPTKPHLAERFRLRNGDKFRQQRPEVRLRGLPRRAPRVTLGGGSGNPTGRDLREGCAPAGPGTRRACADAAESGRMSGAAGARRRWQQSYRCLRRAHPGSAPRRQTRPNPAVPVLAAVDGAGRAREVVALPPVEGRGECLPQPAPGLQRTHSAARTGETACGAGSETGYRTT